MKVLGIDPGAVSGGCAIVLINDSVAPQRVDAIDLPVIGIKAKQRVDVLALRAWVQQHKPDHAVIERGQAMPRQGASSGFKFGRGCGAIEAAIQLLEIPLTIIEPTAWKKFHHLRGSDKEAGRQRALQLFPSAQALLARRKDHGRAEAALIALMGIKIAGGQASSLPAGPLTSPPRNSRWPQTYQTGNDESRRRKYR